VRKLQAQDGNVVGEEEPATPKKIFQLLDEVNLYQQFFIAVKMCHD
jgi:ribosome-associated toxin RatA of RatAB toxin-antitoxin module